MRGSTAGTRTHCAGGDAGVDGRGAYGRTTAPVQTARTMIERADHVEHADTGVHNRSLPPGHPAPRPVAFPPDTLLDH
ncbi:hypothetical protein [Streptomyces aurantiogriseus]|uniref:Uncharacterized protein n=1 Tax=Streptomyces aurantiogriseus TaxID=66870 RepID=A0A918CHX3_9ACTN|nr:hypothetical protein [Streptomyces aurantiogriseus]GGR26121.1 hypothetical protein GCM10010251_47860 [Streptomyces aurantiogriseus]